MTINEPLIVKCPDCNTIFRFIGIGSYTVCIDGAFSDGFSFPSTLSAPSVMPVFYCRRCKQWKALSSVVELFQGPMEFIEADDVPELPKSWLKEEELESALKQSWPEDIELGLRLKLLQIQNAERRNKIENIPAEGSLRENLNRLSELIKAEDRPFMAAEIRRELGDFDRALAIVEKLGAEDDSRIPALKEKIAEKNVNPFFIITGEETTSEPAAVCMDIKEEASPELRERFRFYPPPEDVLAFPSFKNIKDIGVPHFLLKIPIAGGLWMPCIGNGIGHEESEDFLIRHGRVFAEWEWAWFDKNVIWEWESELKWFWAHNSETMADKDDEEADRYYKRLYQIRYNQCFINDDYGLDTEGLNYPLEVQLDAMLDRFEDRNDYYRTFWDLYWRYMGTDLLDDFDPMTFDLEEERAARKKAEEEIELERKKEIELLRPIEEGWNKEYGCYFVEGIENSPDRIVYDPDEKRIHQFTEYD